MNSNRISDEVMTYWKEKTKKSVRAESITLEESYKKINQYYNLFTIACKFAKIFAALSCIPIIGNLFLRPFAFSRYEFYKYAGIGFAYCDIAEEIADDEYSEYRKEN